MPETDTAAPLRLPDVAVAVPVHPVTCMVTEAVSEAAAPPSVGVAVAVLDAWGSGQTKTRHTQSSEAGRSKRSNPTAANARLLQHHMPGLNNTKHAHCTNVP